MVVTQGNATYKTDNMALVAYLLMRGYDAMGITHEKNGTDRRGRPRWNVQWEYLRNDELDMIVGEFDKGVVSVNMPAYFSIWSKVRDDLYDYLRTNRLMTPRQRD